MCVDEREHLELIIVYISKGCSQLEDFSVRECNEDRRDVATLMCSRKDAAHTEAAYAICVAAAADVVAP